MEGASVTAFFQSLGRPVAYYPIFAKKLGGVNAAVMFCQLSYWHRIDSKADGEWIYKTIPEMEDETGLSRWEQDTAKRCLAKCGVLEVKVAGIPAKTHYKINWQAFTDLWDKLDCGEPSDKYVENQQTSMLENHNLSITETTTETTTESLSLPPAPIKKRGRPPKHSPQDIALFKTLGDMFVERGGHWAAGTAEAASLYRLIAWAKLEEPERYEEFLVGFLDAVWALKNGKLDGMSQFDTKRWSDLAYCPSSVLGGVKKLHAVLERLGEANRELPPELAKYMEFK